MESKQNRYILIGLTIICVVLIVVTSITDSWLAPLRTGVGYALIPIQSGVNRVGSVIYDELVDFSQLKTALEENAALKQEVSELTETNNRLMSQQFELERLRQLYELDQNYLQYEKVAARVIANDTGDWFQVFRINKGSADGIEVGNNVMAGGGLVGIVTDTGANYATVRSIIDDSSRVSAMAMQSGDTCLVGGDLTLYKEGRLRISNIKKNADVKEGDRIVTSNISSAFLPGILIGYATDITVDSNQLTSSGYLIPVAEFDSLQEVLIITQVKQTGDTTGE
ncbi:MAG: rod shape-determining protein MreC [Hungatella hathewayi]|nr:rod shape-determining protein MreC [Hungatella hathewayi]